MKEYKISNEFVGGIEKNVPLITNWHRTASRIMTNGDCEGRIFTSHPYTNNWHRLIQHFYT